jgi:cytochrome c-type biogenesis protein CcmE
MKSPRLMIAIMVVVVGIVGLSFLNLGESMVYYYTPSEVLAKSSSLDRKTISLGGMVQPGSVNWDAENVLLQFTATDLKGNDIPVRFTGSRPDLFKEGQGVVAEGQWFAAERSFRATRLFVKHSEEYKKPGDHSSMNQEYLERSLFKNEDTKASPQ